jgi:Bacterial antitoxin of type II TA system, VapB
MKTTLEIADPLLEEAKRIAATEGETLRSLVEQGLRAVLAERKRKRKPFKLRDASFKGTGVTPEFQGAGWDKLREAIYEGRGG